MDAESPEYIINFVARSEAVSGVMGADFEPLFIENGKMQLSCKWPVEFAVRDIPEGPVAGAFEAAYSLDLIKHMPAATER